MAVSSKIMAAGTKPLRGERIEVLSYFYGRCENGQNKMFKGRCEKNLILFSDDDMKRIRRPLGPLPTIGFCEADTRQASLRTLVFPQSEMRRFADVTIRYIRESEQKADSRSRPAKINASDETRNLVTSTKGLQAKVYEFISDEYNVWSSYSHSSHVGPDTQEGNINILLEFSHIDFTKWATMCEDLTSKFDSVQRVLVQEGMDHLRFKSIQVKPVPGISIFISIKSELGRRRDFIKYCKEEGNAIGLLDSEFQCVSTYVDPNVTSKVADTIRDCNGLVQFYMSDNNDGDNKSDMRWLEVEYFAALTLQIPSVRIADSSMIRRQKIFPIISKDQPVIEVNNPSEEHMRQKIREALEQLVEIIRKRQLTA